MKSCFIYTCSFLWINESGWEFVLKKAYGEKLKLLERHMVQVYIGIVSMRQFQCVPTTYVTENKEENYSEIYIFQVSCPLSLPLLNISNCQSVLKFYSSHSTTICLYLHDSYISKFEIC